jgi:hypothetical protein
MLAQWTRILPHFVVVWLAKRYAERIEAVPGLVSANPYRNEILSWKNEDEVPKRI